MYYIKVWTALSVDGNDRKTYWLTPAGKACNESPKNRRGRQKQGIDAFVLPAPYVCFALPIIRSEWDEGQRGLVFDVAQQEIAVAIAYGHRLGNGL